MPERLSPSVISRILARLQGSLDRHLAALSRDPTVMIVHHTRVSIRRLRIALRALKGQLDPRLRKRYRSGLRKLAADLEATREADACELVIADLIAHQSSVSHEQALQLLRIAGERCGESRRDLQNRMQTPSWRRRVARLQRYPRDPAMLAPRDAPLLIRDVLTAQHRRLRRALGHIGHKPRKLHRLRLLIKETRYLDEDFGSFLPMHADRELKRLRQLQNRLGEFHDNWCLRKWLRSQPQRQSIATEICRALDARQEQLITAIYHASKPLRKASVEHALGSHDRVRKKHAATIRRRHSRAAAVQRPRNLGSRFSTKARTASR